MLLITLAAAAVSFSAAQGGEEPCLSTIVGDVSDDCTVNVQGYAAQPSFQIRNCVERERERERVEKLAPAQRRVGERKWTGRPADHANMGGNLKDISLSESLPRMQMLSC